MRRTVLIFTISLLLLSCSDPGKTKVSDADTSYQNSNRIQEQLQRQSLIEELKRLQSVIASKDIEKIADLFSFPLVDTTVNLFIDDSSFTEDYKKNSETVTRAMFIKYFPQAYNDLQLDEFNQLFKNLEVDSLRRTDTLSNKIKNRQEPCYKFYNVFVDKDRVIFEYGTNSNTEYVDNSKKPEEEEGFGDECEYASFWWFHFDGKRLTLVKHLVAG